MDEEEGRGPRLSKRFSDNNGKEGEVDYKTKAGTAWSHSYLNQKPWHPLSYPNQRRKWIAEQTHAERDRHAQEVAREYAQEQDFFRQTALVSKKEKEKMEMMKAVSFMYIRPPGYNPESAKAAEVADEMKIQNPDNTSQDKPLDVASAPVEEKKKPRPKDVFGRALPTEEQFEVLKNAPRLETGVAARAKPFGIEIRNVKCLRCGTYGHQSGDRECPLKDAIMPNEESRLRKDDPLTAMMAHVDSSEPLKWELKQKPGMSPPRGGFKPDDPNQQIVAEDIFDEYGGFLGEDIIPELLTNFSSSKPKKSKRKKHKSKRRHSINSSTDELTDHHHRRVERSSCSSSSDNEDHHRRPKKMKKTKHKEKRRKQSDMTSSSGDVDSGCHKSNNRDGHRHRHRDRRNYYSSSSEDDGDGYRHTSKHSRRHGHRHRRRGETD